MNKILYISVIVIFTIIVLYLCCYKQKNKQHNKQYNKQINKNINKKNKTIGKDKLLDKKQKNNIGGSLFDLFESDNTDVSNNPGTTRTSISNNYAISENTPSNKVDYENMKKVRHIQMDFSKEMLNDNVILNPFPLEKQELNKTFNYNHFQIEFTINRDNKMVCDLDGGIMTIASNKDNFHNLIFYIKKTEFIIGKAGYNTHLSINLNKVNTSTMIKFTIQYKNPYVNVHVKTLNKKGEINQGYIDYLGNLSPYTNDNFRLYLYPLVHSWCILGTTSLLIDKEYKTLSGIFSSQSTSISNIILSHKKRDLVEKINNKNISNKIFNRTDVNFKNIFVMEITLKNNNVNKNAILLNCITNTNKYFEVHKMNNNIKFILYDNIGDYTIEIPNTDNINNIYFEIVPYMNKHMLYVYIDDKFYSYIIDISILKNNKQDTSDTSTDILTGGDTDTSNDIIIQNITVNNNVSKFIKDTDISNQLLVNNFKLYTETFIYPTTEDYKLLTPTQKKENDSTLLFNFNKNVKVESIKYLLNNDAVYKFYAKNIFDNNWKLINRLHFENKNKNRFLNRDMIINDNIISSEYKLELNNSLYYISPANFIQISGNKNIIKNDKKFDTHYLRYIAYNNTNSSSSQTDQSAAEPSTIWRFEDNGVDSNGNEKYKIYSMSNNSYELYNNTQNYILEKKPNTTNIYYFYAGNSTTSNNILYMNESNERLTKSNNNSMKKTNCEFEIIPIPVIPLRNSTSIIELNGIENPYPKLYINNNDLTKSLNPCSTIYTDKSEIVPNMITKVISMTPDKDDNYTESEIQVKRNSAPTEKITNNLYGTNKTNIIYNFCSNNFKRYNNKMYNYDYDVDKYYYQQQQSPLYNSKNRIVLNALSEAEKELYENIENLKIGVSLVGNNNKVLKSINGKGNLKKYPEIWTENGSVDFFKLEWNTTEQFKSPIEINLKNKEDRYLHDIKITKNAFDTISSLKNIISTILNNVNNKIKSDINAFKTQNNKNNTYLQFSLNYNKGEWDSTKMEYNDNIIEYPPDNNNQTCIETQHNDNTRNIAANSLLDFVNKIERDVDIIFHGRKWHITGKNLIGRAEDNYNKWGDFTKFKKKLNNYMRGGKTIKGGTTSTYTLYERDQKNYIRKIITDEIISEKTKIENDGTSISDIYNTATIPDFKTQSSHLTTDKLWQLEWEGIYDVNNTEFYLYHKIRNEYLENNEGKIYWSKNKVKGKGWKLIKDYQPVNDNILTTQFTSLSDNLHHSNSRVNSREKAKKLCDKIDATLAYKKTMEDKSLCADSFFEDGYGYHMTTTTSGCGNAGWNTANYNNGYAMCDLSNENYLDKIIYDKINKINLTQISDIINKSNKHTSDFIDKFNKDNEKTLNADRIEVLRTVANADGCYLFSPNLGVNGKFLNCGNEIKEKLSWSEGTNNLPQNKLYIEKWSGTDNDIKSGNEIKITKDTEDGQKMLKNRDENGNFIWVPKNSSQSTNKWNIEFNNDLILDLSKKEVNKEQLILQNKYTIISIDTVTPNIGEKVKEITFYNKDIDVYGAITLGQSQNLIPGKDYSWIEIEDKKIIFYDDNYCNWLRDEDRNKLTKGYYVLPNDRRTAELYNDYNLLKYTITHLQKWDELKHGPAYEADTGVDEFIAKYKNYGYLPDALWIYKQKQYLDYTETSTSECIKMFAQPMDIYLKSSTEDGYLRSDQKDEVRFSKEKKQNMCAWKIIIPSNIYSTWGQEYNALVTRKEADYKLIAPNKWCYYGKRYDDWGYMGYTDSALECANKFRLSRSKNCLEGATSQYNSCKLNVKTTYGQKPAVPWRTYFRHFAWHKDNQKCYWIYVVPHVHGKDCKDLLKDNSGHNFYRLENLND